MPLPPFQNEIGLSEGKIRLPATQSFLSLPLFQDEMDLSEGKIRELISTLDARKNEAIERTFKGVAKHFRDVFRELVAGGWKPGL